MHPRLILSFFAQEYPEKRVGMVIQLISHNSTPFFSTSHNFKNPLKSPPHRITFSRLDKIRAVETIRGNAESEATPSSIEENPAINFAFVHSVLLPDRTPDVHYRTSCGGQKLRDIMMENDVELYGPYARPLFNCAGGGTCGSCIVEVVEGRELLSPRTDKEKEHLKKHPKNWRLACQTTVGKADSRGQVIVQQLPEWKSHEWTYEKELPIGEETESI